MGQLFCLLSWQGELCREWLFPSKEAQRSHGSRQSNPSGDPVAFRLGVTALAKGTTITFGLCLDAKCHRVADPSI